MVPRERIELPTQSSSGFCSTTELPRLKRLQDTYQCRAIVLTCQLGRCVIGGGPCSCNCFARVVEGAYEVFDQKMSKESVSDEKHMVRSDYSDIFGCRRD